MKSIRVIDKDFNVVGEIDCFDSFSHTRRWRGSGGFDLRVELNDITRECLKKDNIIIFDKRVDLVGIVEHCEIDGKGQGDFFAVRGKTISGLLERRVIVPENSQTWATEQGKQETIIKNFITKNCINPTNAKRKIERLEVAQDKGRGKDDKWRSSYDNLEEKLNEICEYSKFGYDINLDLENKKFIFDIYEGRDLTIEQSTLPPVIFSSRFNNILNRKYTESTMGTCNAVYAGTKEEEGKMVLNYGEESGMARRENFLSVSEDTADAIKKEASNYLEEMAEIKTFELEVSPDVNFIYLRDYKLGDLVTIEDRNLKITMNSRIVEVVENYTGNQRSLTITFDKLIPNLIDKLRKL